MTDQDPTQAFEAPVADRAATAPIAAGSALPPPPAPAVEPVPTRPVEPTTAPARPGRSRVKWLVALVASLLVVGTAAGATLMLTAQAGQPAVLAWAPADSILYAEARLDLPGTQRAELAKVMAAFPGFNDQAAFPTKLNEAIDLLVGKATDGKMSYKTDIEPWFGGQVSVSIGPIPASGDRAAARGLVLVSVKDAAAAGAWAGKLLAESGGTVATESYAGVTISTVTAAVSGDVVSGMTGAWAVSGPVLALGDTASVKAAIDTKGTAGLPTVAQFKTAEASVKGDRLGFAYLDTAALLKGAESTGGAAGEAMPSLPAFVDKLQLPWTAYSVRAQAGTLVIETSAPHVAAMGAAKSAESKLPALVPPTTVALVEGHDLGAALQRVKGLVAEDPSLADGLKQVDDALALLGGYGAIVDWMGEAGVVVTRTGDTLAGGLVVMPTDPTAARRLFTQLRGFLDLAGSSAGLTVSEESYGGTTIVVVDLGDLGALAGAATGGAVEAPANIKIAYAVTDEVVVLGSGVDFVKSVLDARTGDSLAKSARFTDALKLVSSVNASLVWLDLAGIRSFVDTQVPASERGAYETDVKPYLDAFDSVIGSSTPGETLDRSILVVRVSGS